MTFFGQRKPKQFNFKPVYLKEEEGAERSFYQKMHKQWNRVTYSQLLKEGKRKTTRTIVFALAIAYLAVKVYDYFIQTL